ALLVLAAAPTWTRFVAADCRGGRLQGPIQDRQVMGDYVGVEPAQERPGRLRVAPIEGEPRLVVDRQRIAAIGAKGEVDPGLLLLEVSDDAGDLGQQPRQPGATGSAVDLGQQIPTETGEVVGPEPS